MHALVGLWVSEWGARRTDLRPGAGLVQGGGKGAGERLSLQLHIFVAEGAGRKILSKHFSSSQHTYSQNDQPPSPSLYRTHRLGSLWVHGMVSVTRALKGGSGGRVSFSFRPCRGIGWEANDRDVMLKDRQYRPISLSQTA